MTIRLSFRPDIHGFHFHNNFHNHFTGGFPAIDTDGLCGGMVLAAFNYFRYGLPIPPLVDAEMDFAVSFEILRTQPGTMPLVEYIFQSQVGTFTNVSSLSFLGPADPVFHDEFQKARNRIDTGQYSILGLKMRPGRTGYGHQVLCYGYDPDAQGLLVYDPNFPDEEMTLTAQRVDANNFIILHGVHGGHDDRYRAMFEQQELLPDRISDRVTYDWPDNVFRNLNYAVRPPRVNAQEGWRWCRRCEGMWHVLNHTAGACPAGGGHVQDGSGAYSLLLNYRQSSGQNNWCWCHKCQGLFFGNGRVVNGTCPAGGQHDGSASGNYTMIFETAANRTFTQSDWRWCNKCQGMHFSRNAVCPAGGLHEVQDSGNYMMLLS